MLHKTRYTYDPRHWAISSRNLWFMLDVQRPYVKLAWTLKLGEFRITWH